MVVSVVSQPRVLDDRRFFTGMALAMAAATFVGFAPTYFLAAWNDAPTPVLTQSVQIHGALCTAWMLLFVAQTGLIAARRPDIHRLTGVAGVVLGVAVLVSGFFLAINSERRVHSAATADTLADPYVFLIFPLSALGVFALFAIIGIANRLRPDVHKRLMLLATMSLLMPALARIAMRGMLALSAPGATFVDVPAPIGGMFLVDLFLAALVVHDFATQRRLHPATLWGGGFLLVSQPLRVMIGYSQPWQDFARMLMG